jgi:hypothetical protein
MADDTQAAIDASIAAANRAEATGNHETRASAATNALKLMTERYRQTPSANPRNGAEASALLDHLNKTSPEWRRDVLAGNSRAVGEFNRLNKMVADADPVELAARGITPPSEVDENNGGVAGGPETVAAFNHFGDIGELETEQDMNVLQGFMRDQKYDAAEFELAKQVHAELTGDPQFLQKLKSGDPFTRKMFLRTSMVIAAGADPSLPRNLQTEKLLQERWAARYRDGRIT